MNGTTKAQGNKNWFGISKAKNPFSKGNIGNTIGGIAQAATPIVSNVISGALSGGLESGVGNAVGKIGSIALGTIGGVIGGPLGSTIGSVAGDTLGGLVTGAVGIKWNDDKIKGIKSNTSNMRSAGTALGQALDSSSFFNAAGNMASGLTINWRDLGSTGWARSNDSLKDKANELQKAQNRALAYQTHAMGNSANRVDSLMDSDIMSNFAAYGGILDSVNPSTPIGYSIYTDKFINNKQKETSNMANMFAGTPDIFGFGGGIYTKGANFDTGVSYINNGGTHE